MSLGMAGAAPQPLLFTELSNWMDLRGYTDPAEREELADMLHELDVTFLGWAAKQRAQ